MFGLAIAVWAVAQASFVTDDRVAVFYPAGYDAAQHQPSPIFVREPVALSPLPDSWTLRPVFSHGEATSVATIHVGGAVDLYGTGEVTGPLRRNGRTISLWNADTPAYGVDGGTHLYQSHPWVMGLRPDGTAFGIIADNTWRQTITTGDDIIFESRGPAFRVVIIERDTPQQLMQALADLTGHMEMPPLWSLGYQQCRFSYEPDSRVREVADTLRLLQIPSDVIWMDIDYMDHYKIFTFSPEGFPDPKGLNDYLHQRDFKAVYMIDPGVKAETGYFVDDQGTAGDYWVKDSDGNDYVGNVWPGPCHFPDFTRPDVRTWWATLYRDYMATGIDGVWNDMNEPSVFSGSFGSMPEDNQHGAPASSPVGGDKTATSHLRYHNVYGLNMVRASREGLLLANPQLRPFILSRSNFLGGQRYAATWTGDNLSSADQMELSIPMSLTLGLSGQPFSGPDIGGFCGNGSAELLARWTAQGVYFPFVRNHNIKGAIDQEPWAFDGQTLNTCRTAIERRYLLMPYIYTAFREASVTGMPVMRPLFMADAKDLSLRSEDRAFLLGGDVMVVPDWAGPTAMPKGGWQQLDLAPMNSDARPDPVQARLLQRPGSIVPIANLAQSTAQLHTDSLTLMVCLDDRQQAEGTLYEDEGDGFGYRKGHYRLSRISATATKRRITVSIAKAEGDMDEPERMLRVGYLSSGKVRFTPWQKGSTVSVNIKRWRHIEIPKSRNPEISKYRHNDITKNPETVSNH